jgi:Domain of unknown function (DUF4390)
MNARVGRLFAYRHSAVRVLLFLAMAMHAPSVSASAETVELHADIEPDVIYCDVQLGQNPDVLAATLRDGTQVTFSWTVKVYEVKPYWFDSEVASVHIEHQVIPDLVTRRWLLADLTTGIHRRTGSLDDALAFLTQLQHFPVIDRSLLKRGKSYRLEIQLEETKGEIERGWWARLWGHEQTTGTLVFSLP